MAFSGDRTSRVILKYAGEAGPPGKKIELGPESAEMEDVKPGTESDPFFHGPFEL